MMQRHGTDLDPHNNKWQPRGEGPSGQASRKPIQASADVQEGNVKWGFLKAGDRQYGGGDQQYDLIGDDVLAALPPPPPPVLPRQDGPHDRPADPPGEAPPPSLHSIDARA
jgi:hypothetical protein